MENLLIGIGTIFAIIVGGYILSIIGAAIACLFGYKPQEDTSTKDMVLFAILGIIVVVLFVFFISLFK